MESSFKHPSRDSLLSPFFVGVGQTGFGVGIGCGVGVGVGQPINLSGVPVLSSIMSGLSSGLSSIPGLHHLRAVATSFTGKIDIKGLRSGAGCGVGVGYGYGAGLFLKPSTGERLVQLATGVADSVMARLPPPLQPLQPLQPRTPNPDTPPGANFVPGKPPLATSGTRDHSEGPRSIQLATSDPSGGQLDAFSTNGYRSTTSNSHEGLPRSADADVARAILRAQTRIEELEARVALLEHSQKMVMKADKRSERRTPH